MCIFTAQLIKGGKINEKVGKKAKKTYEKRTAKIPFFFVLIFFS